MATFNLTGRWIQVNWEINITQQGDEFNAVAVSPELQKYWSAGHGEVFENGRMWITISGPEGDATIEGNVAPDGNSIALNNGVYWARRIY